jgi:ubiquinone/menaquinone biosynthesis C-methylase UbiE
LKLGSSLFTSIEALLAKRDAANIVALLRLSGTETVADVGAGYGYVASKVADQSKTLIAIEPDRRRARHMHRTYQNFDCISAVGEAIPFRNSSFDKSYAKKSLHHTTNLDEALQELNRIMKPTGCLVIHELRPEGRWKLVAWFERKMRRTHMSFLTPDALKHRLEKAGFSVKFLENKATGYYVLAEKK